MYDVSLRSIELFVACQAAFPGSVLWLLLKLRWLAR